MNKTENFAKGKEVEVMTSGKDAKDEPAHSSFCDKLKKVAKKVKRVANKVLDKMAEGYAYGGGVGIAGHIMVAPHLDEVARRARKEGKSQADRAKEEGTKISPADIAKKARGGR